METNPILCDDANGCISTLGCFPLWNINSFDVVGDLSKNFE